MRGRHGARWSARVSLGGRRSSESERGTRVASRKETATGAEKDAERIFADNYPRVYRAVLRLVHDPAEAEDLTQETFAKAFGALPSFRGDSTLLTWLTRIARNTVLDRFREVERRRAGGWQPLEPSALESIPEARASTAPEAVERTASGACIQACVDVLPPSQRQVIELHDMLGLTAREIAEMLDVSVGAVKIRLHRARGKLRAAFDRHCDVYSTDRNELACRPKPHAAREVRRHELRRREREGP